MSFTNLVYYQSRDLEVALTPFLGQLKSLFAEPPICNYGPGPAKLKMWARGPNRTKFKTSGPVPQRRLLNVAIPSLRVNFSNSSVLKNGVLAIASNVGITRLACFIAKSYIKVYTIGIFSQFPSDCK